MKANFWSTKTNASVEDETVYEGVVIEGEIVDEDGADDSEANSQFTSAGLAPARDQQVPYSSLSDRIEAMKRNNDQVLASSISDLADISSGTPKANAETLESVTQNINRLKGLLGR